ncbi:Uncharacterised protein [Klebsiella pneumoniae]|nr:Uncharacterised protein [Klebsiella pneumoniae]
MFKIFEFSQICCEIFNQKFNFSSNCCTDRF